VVFWICKYFTASHWLGSEIHWNYIFQRSLTWLRSSLRFSKSQTKLCWVTVCVENQHVKFAIRFAIL